MYEHILVAVDGSSTSDLAVREAAMLGKHHHSSLRLVHVVDEVNIAAYSEFASMEALRLPLIEAGRGILDKAVALVRESGLGAETKLLELDALRRHVPGMIAEEARSWPADLIVIGTHGRRGLQHLFLGSVAEGVARCATVPVLLVRGS